MRYLKPDDVFDVACPACGARVEFFRDDHSRKCPSCDERFNNPKLDMRCAEWCQYAEECLGYAPERGPAAADGREGPLVSALIGEMKAAFGADQNSIAHALAVFRHAKEIAREEGGDPRVVFAAALLHDIGIQDAERKHGSSAGKYQEIEGPPIVRKILDGIGLDAGVTDHVCRIVANHHSARDIDTTEFRILWDADWLVNFPGEFPSTDQGRIEAHIEKVFKTDAGKRKARELFGRQAGRAGLPRDE